MAVFSTDSQVASDDLPKSAPVDSVDNRNCTLKMQFKAFPTGSLSASENTSCSDNPVPTTA